METYGQVISRITNAINALQKDSRKPKRYILSVFKEKGQYLLSQKIRDRTIYRETNLFKWLNCVELKQIDTIKCPIIEFRTCKSLVRSKKKLPNILGSKYGYAVLVVQTIDGEKIYQPTTLREYNNNKKRANYELFSGQFYYISDNYLYIPDTEIEVVDVLLLTFDEDYERSSSCSEFSECYDVYAQKVPLPKKIAEVAIQETVREIVGTIGIVSDTNSDLDSNQKGATIG